MKSGKKTRTMLVASLLLLAGVMPAFAQPTPAEANSSYQSQHWEEAAEAYGALAEQDSTNGIAWYRWANSLKQLGEYDKAIEVWKALEARGSAPPIVKHNIGTAYALNGQKQQAFDWLAKAAEAGFGNTQMLDSDPAWADLRDEARFAELAAEVGKNARPCDYSENHRAFDFWAGEWEVHNSGGQRLGENSIQKQQNGCVLVEHWTSGSGGTGMSINYYDPGRAKWVQNWVGAGGWIVDMEGGIAEDGSMVLEGTSTTINSPTARIRATWTPLPDGRVRQFFETSNDDGVTWTTAFEGFYSRQDETAEVETE